ncbi:PTS cellobiose transporter subunit IIB [Dissulfurispira thermophila]|uniref:PTS cellobiose transporter subunit IIB n=2 Tax=root TaxID=1 RepID=A0A7G1H135_9BACT|nr:efflux RND transporter periplasmic adaptor subunit [Dissulfurispira thermophila]BCB95922.1 PTS cellobiose transporter subunit IIB [Dissulfurispira thermophila]
MKKRKLLMVAVGLILIASLLLYFSKAISLNTILKNRGADSLKAQPSEHQSTSEQQTTTEGQMSEEPPTVEIPPDKQQLIGVKTVEVSIKPLQKIIRTVGRIEYDERRLFTVNTKFEGWIEKLYVNYTGRYVKKGEPLAEIYSPELFATQQEFINVTKWAKQSKEIKNETMSNLILKDAEAIIEAAKQRLRLWDITDEQIKKIEETGKPIRTLTIYSPVNGYIVQKTALQGMRVMPGEKLFDVADLSTIWIISDIYEYELPLIKIGQKANINLSYFPGKEFSSAIDYVYPTLAGETRTAKVRFTIANPGGQLKPQMFTNVEIKINIGNKLTIPEDAVIDTGTRQIVYVDRGEGYFEPREVILGLRAEGLREVITGLKAGEKVASSATFLIDSEAKLKGIEPITKKQKEVIN